MAEKVIQTDRDRLLTEFENDARRLDRIFEALDLDAQLVEERRRKHGKELDGLLDRAADELDDDEFFDIFGHYPDRSNVDPGAETGEAKKRAPYERTINECLDRMHPAPANRDEIDPRHIEAVLRGQFHTLDGLHLDEFQKSVEMAVRILQELQPETAERLAVSHGI